MYNLTPKQKKFLIRCVEKNIEILDSEKDSSVIEELNGINKIISDNSFQLQFGVGVEFFKEVDECLEQLSELTRLYSNMVDLQVLQEYDVIKKRMTSLLDYLATLKDLINNEVNFSEDVLKKEFKAQISKLIVEEQGISLTQAEKVVYADDRYASQLRRLKPYVDYGVITKTKYDLYIRVLQSVTQSVSTANKSSNAQRMFGDVHGE